MKFNLHNKYEVTINGKTIVAYNTLTNNVYQKIANLEPYNGYIALGTGTSPQNPADTKLTTYIKSYKAETELISANVKNDELFVVKVVTLDENDTSSFTFSELGLAASSESNPDIYNHVVLTDSEGQAVTVTRNTGDVLQIKVTIYLELEPTSTIQFQSGDNSLIKRILGEESTTGDGKLYAVRGQCLAKSNVDFYRCLPDMTKKVQCTSEVTTSENQYSINFSAKLGSGKTEEILLIFDKQVVLRVSTLESKTPLNISTTLTDIKTNLAEIDTDVKNLLTLSNSTFTDDNPVKLKFYATTLTDKNTKVFDNNFTYQTTKYLSKDGQMLAFISETKTYLYRYENFNLIRVNDKDLPCSNIINLIMGEGKLLFIMSESPYIRIFEVVNNEAVEISTATPNYNMTGYPHSFISSDATFTTDGKIMLGVIVNHEAHTPIVLKLSKNSNGNYADELMRIDLEYADKVIGLYKSPFCEANLIFITSLYQGLETYGMQMVTASEVKYVGSTLVAYGIYKSSLSIQNGGKIIMSEKAQTPTLRLYYLPNFAEVTNSTLTNDATKHYLSYDGDYMVCKYSDGSYKIYNCHANNLVTEFEEGYKDLIDFSVAKDFVFIGDMLLVFTSNTEESVYSLMLKKNHARLDNLASETAITYSKYDFLGTNQTEGVKLNFKLNFNTGGEE